MNDRPLEVVTLGNSLGHLVIPTTPESNRKSYAAVLRDELCTAGLPARVHLESRWFDFAVDALDRYEESVRAHLPDVVVLNYGLNESQPWLMPIPVLRHLMTTHNVTTPAQERYREQIVRPVWRGVRRYRRWASRHVGTSTWQTRPDRFEAAMRTLINLSRKEIGALVLVLDVAPPGPMLTHFLPGQEVRHRQYQDLLANLVRGFDDPQVRLIRTEDFIVEQGFPAAMPDGMHYSAEGHAQVGRMLADEIARWAPEHDWGRAVASEVAG